MGNLDDLGSIPPIQVWEGVVARTVDGERLSLGVVRLFDLHDGEITPRQTHLELSRDALDQRIPALHRIHRERKPAHRADVPFAQLRGKHLRREIADWLEPCLFVEINGRRIDKRLRETELLHRWRTQSDSSHVAGRGQVVVRCLRSWRGWQRRFRLARHEQTWPYNKPLTQQCICMHNIFRPDGVELADTSAILMVRLILNYLHHLRCEPFAPEPFFPDQRSDHLLRIFLLSAGCLT